MEFRTYKNRIVLVDDQELALAEIDFPAREEEPGTVEITHTYVDESLRGKGLAGKLMTRLIHYLEQHELKAYPSCSYAVTWFSRHPEAASLLSAAYRKETGMAATLGSAAQPSDSTGSLDVPDAVRPRSVTAESTPYAAPQVQETLRPAAPSMASRNEEEEAPGFYPGEYETEEEDGPVDGGLGDHLLMGVNRVLQLFSVAALLLLYILMIVPALQNLEALGPIASMITDQNMAEISYITVFLALTVFTLISLFWILSRKKYVRYGTLETIDTGRGITTFAALLLIELAATLLSPIENAVEPVLIGLAIASTQLVVNRAMILMAALVGLVLSIVRRVIHH